MCFSELIYNRTWTRIQAVFATSDLIVTSLSSGVIPQALSANSAILLWQLFTIVCLSFLICKTEITVPGLSVVNIKEDNVYHVEIT